ncbi:hypothetical protein CFC21_027825 [Triticum aestivum]|uniref:DUF4228 domain-containing protein n=4 Tax=Triticinae TaxID=1648030 RepID=A0A453AJ95_AEGTS|nr:uncharacterized protein LOC109771050 [Aegilops tauschii subsp. strangulata]XP_044327584.1 uncharacterized protein LOC123048567 [Triticum aestivum]KAF7013774.1 hypothetical protein CFC21_027825 [Triticum aestivum]
MGNCQAADAAAVVIQHPGDGKVERLHWPATAADVMRRNPGHYVALVVLHHVDSEPGPAVAGERGGARITKIKLLKPKDTLLLGQVYRLITSQEVTKAVQTRKQERMRGCDEAIEQQRPRLHRRRHLPRLTGDDAATAASGEQRQPADHQERKRLEKDRHHRSITAAPGRGRGRGGHWRPALQSITESSSSGHTDCEDTRK